MYKRTSLFILSIMATAILLGGCSPSKNYEGKWYGLIDGDKVKVDFSNDKKMTLDFESDQESESHDFSQTGTGFVNNTSYYKIKLNDKVYYIVFEDKKDKDNAIIVEPENHADDFKDMVGNVVCEMNRDDYPDPDEESDTVF